MKKDFVQEAYSLAKELKEQWYKESLENWDGGYLYDFSQKEIIEAVEKILHKHKYEFICNLLSGKDIKLDGERVIKDIKAKLIAVQKQTLDEWRKNNPHINFSKE